ncbi:hypothetical protein HDU96_008703 [Phlyctochytrium bullatum]|nr:hypothetical protein HDU96_008703 [Phlyctochytrium bullatum]
MPTSSTPSAGAPQRMASMASTTSSPSATSSSFAVIDRARPARMTVQITSVSLIPVTGALSPPPSLIRIKFKGVESPLLPMLDSNNNTLPECSFVVTYHSHCFDSLKVDVYEEDAQAGLLSRLARRKRNVHRGRGKTGLKDMVDWHEGVYAKELQLFDPKDPSYAVGTATVLFRFSALILPHEEQSPADLLEAEADETDAYAAVALSGGLPSPSTYFQAAAATPAHPDAEDAAAGDSDSESIEDDEEFEEALELVGEVLSLPVDGVLDPDTQPAYFTSDDVLPRKPTVPAPTLDTRTHFLRTGTVVSLVKAVENRHIAKSKTMPTSLDDTEAAAPLKRLLTARASTVDMARSRSARGVSPTTPTSPTRSRSIASTRRSSTSAGAAPAPLLRAPTLLPANASHNLGEIANLFRGFLKHDFPLTSTQAVRAVRLLYRFENGLPVPRTGRIIKDVSKAAEAVRAVQHSLCAYGALVLGFCNGTMNARDNLRTRANEKTAAEFLELREEDFLYWERGRREICKAKYYVVHDRRWDAVVVCCQGTIHLTQIITDLNAEYFPLLDGAAHLGILRAAQSIVDARLPDLLSWCAQLGVSRLICTGHSLGAGTAALLSVLLDERLEDFKRATGRADFRVLGRCVATPGVTDQRLGERYKGVIENYVMENDIVPRMSFGAAANFKAMILEAHRLIEAKVPEEEAYRLLQAKRIETLKENRDTRGVIPGRVYHIYKTVRRVPKRHHARLGLKTSLFQEAFRTVSLPASEHPEIPHYVMEAARPEFFAFMAPRRHFMNHHLPWAYQKGVKGVLEWLEREEEGREVVVGVVGARGRGTGVRVGRK